VLHLEFARRNKRWTLYQLSQAVRISHEFISLTEKGQGIPDPDQLARLSRVLEVPADLLLKPVVPVGLPVPEDEPASV
jgi:transcriptional regulator with XRE-family HTH domain